MASKNTDLTAERLMTNLQKDLGLTKEQAAGLVGNLAHESAGFKTLQEISPTVRGSRGGYGYGQWTGPRRRQFEAWTKEKGLDPTSYEANYGFLKHELQTNYNGVLRDLKTDDTLKQATRTILSDYENPAAQHQREGSSSVRARDRYANQFFDTITPTEYLGDLEQLDILSPYDSSFLGADPVNAYPETITNDIADVLSYDRSLGDLQLFDSMPRSKPISQDQYSVMGALDQIDGFDTKQDMPVYNPAQEPVQGLAAIDDMMPQSTGDLYGFTPEGRQIIGNEDGSFSTERTITVTDPRINDGQPTNIPTMYGGQIVDDATAADIIANSGGVDPDTGRALEGYPSITAAERAAQQRSSSLAGELPSAPYSEDAFAGYIGSAPLGRVDAFALDDLPSIGGGVDYGVSDTPMGQGSGSLPNLSLNDFGGPVAPSISLRGNNDFWAAEDRAQEAAMNDLERNDTLSSSLASLERAGLLDQLDSINAPPDIAAPENIDLGIGSSAPGTGAFSLRDPQDRIDDAFASVPAETWRETALRQDATPQMYSRLAEERVGNGFDVANAAAVPGDYSSSVSTHQLPDMLDTLPQSKPVAPIDLVGDVQPLYDDYQSVEPVSQPVSDYTLPDTLGALPRSKPQASTLTAQKAAKRMTGIATTALGGAVAGPLGALGGYALGKAIGGPVSNRVGDFVSGGYVGPSGHTYAADTGISRGLAKVDQTGNWGDFWDSNSQTDQTAQMAWDREKAAREGRQIKSLLDAFTDDLSDAFSGKGKTVTGGQTSADTSRQRNSSDRDSSSSSGRSSGGGLFSSLFGGRDDEEDDNGGGRSSGGGTIICSELYHQGYLSKELWQADEKWGRMTARKDPDIIRGYRTWAAPIVRLMKRSPDATRIIAKLTDPWAKQMAYEAGYLPKGNFLGWLTNMVGIPFSWLVGKGLKLHKKWRRKWQA
nr:phage tail tip lysozyme [uncultured Cohaesibacter sp.]